MRNELVTAALELYIETLALETTDINTESAKWHDLYSKECKLFDLLRQMDWSEGEEYRYQVRCYNIDHSIPNPEPKWEDEGPEYDSAGFTEEDRIVNGQYRVRGDIE